MTNKVIDMAKKIERTAPTTRIPYIILLVCIVAIAALSYFIISQPQVKQECPAQNCTAAPAPKHNASEVSRFFGKVMDSYTDLAYAAPTTPKFNSNGLWEEDVVLNQSGKIVKMFVNDSGLALQSIFVEAPIAPTLSNDEVVATGVVKMSGKISCSESKPLVFVFFDLYCPPCLAAESKVQKLEQKFNKSVSFEYKIIPTHTADLEKMYGSNVTRALGYLLCARAQGSLDKFKNCTEGAYEKHQETPLTENELGACVNSSSLNTTALDVCMSSYSIDMNRDLMLAETFSLAGTTQTVPAGAPVVTVDCQYKAIPDYAETAICYAHPELKECK
jgi:thiol-disulfide isomerase/thioredoxin